MKVSRLTNNVYMSQEIENKIYDIINNTLEKHCILSYDTKYEQIGLDSFEFIRLIVELEKEFDFEFADDMLVATNFQTIGNIVDFVYAKIVKN